ncbi:MAG: hypothetical protein ACLU9S_19205 [Oscillospiraceae bacterium]
MQSESGGADDGPGRGNGAVAPAMENANVDMNTGAAWLKGYAGEE